MNRRHFAKGIVAAPLVMPTHASASQQAAPICVFMEEREGAFVLEGTGHMLTEPFQLEAGTYRIEVEIPEPESDSWIFEAQFYVRADGSRSGSFSLTDSNKVPGYGSGAITARESGEYVVEVDYYDGDWKIVLSPI